MVIYKNYDTNIDNFQKQLKEKGIAVIPNILSKLELENSKDDMWNMLEYLTKDFEIPINRNCCETFSSYYELCPLEDMLLQYWKVGHSQYVWNLRQNLNIINIFSKIYNCNIDDLLVSFDSVSIHFPPELTKKGKYQEDKENWYHFDQSSHKKGFHCIQGFINLYDVYEGDSTLSVYESSHLYHEEFFKYFDFSVDKDYYKLTKPQLDFFNNLEECAVLCSAGSLVLWDSRVLHQGLLCSKNRLNNSIRSVVYICMMPRSLSNKKQLRRKQEAFKSLRMTTHWPITVSRFPSFPKKKEYENKQVHLIKEINEPILNNIGYNLIGI